jgi:hypothetical protein
MREAPIHPGAIMVLLTKAFESRRAPIFAATLVVAKYREQHIYLNQENDN